MSRPSLLRPYSGDFFPSMPLLPVQLALKDSAPHSAPQDAIVDTGTDASMVARSLLEEVGATEIYSVGVRTHLHEEVVEAGVYQIDLVLFDTIRIPDVEVVRDDLNDGILLGRDVLNLLRIQLDGPNKTLALLD